MANKADADTLVAVVNKIGMQETLNILAAHAAMMSMASYRNNFLPAAKAWNAIGLALSETADISPF